MLSFKRLFRALTHTGWRIDLRRIGTTLAAAGIIALFLKSDQISSDVSAILMGLMIIFVTRL